MANSQTHQSREIDGIIGACLTPFTEQGAIDYKALEREIDFIVKDADAISIGAVEAAEYTVLSPADRKKLLKKGTEMVAGRVPVIAGASYPSVRGVLELAEFAAEIGADAVQVLMPQRPWGGEPTTGELVKYYSDIATSSPLPIVAYHNPGPGSDPSIETWLRISEIDGVEYFKESSRDITKISRLIDAIQVTGRARYFTTMQPLLITLILGGAGATMPPPATSVGAQVVRAFRDGDLEKATQWQKMFSTFPGRWSRYGLPPVMKAAMRHFGIDIGVPASPYSCLAPEDDAAVRDFFSANRLLA